MAAARVRAFMLQPRVACSARKCRRLLPPFYAVTAARCREGAVLMPAAMQVITPFRCLLCAEA